MHQATAGGCPAAARRASVDHARRRNVKQSERRRIHPVGDVNSRALEQSLQGVFRIPFFGSRIRRLAAY